VARPAADAQASNTAAAFAGRRRPLRSRVARLRASHSYRAVLLLILASFAFAALAGDATWTSSVLLLLGATTLAASVWTSGLAGTDSKGVIALLVVATLSAFALPLSDDNVVEGVAGIVSGLLVIATIGAIAVGVVDQDEVNAHSVTGAICIYVLLGILFVFLFSAVAVLGHGSFFAQGTDGARADRLYFSFVTLTTVGFGDLTPAAELGRTLAVLEALTGQLYLVTVLALLVSRLRRTES
jgi:hypothetical protein